MPTPRRSLPGRQSRVNRFSPASSQESALDGLVSDFSFSMELQDPLAPAQESPGGAHAVEDPAADGGQSAISQSKQLKPCLDGLPDDLLLRLCDFVLYPLRLTLVNKQFASLLRPLLMRIVAVRELEAWKYRAILSFLQQHPDAARGAKVLRAVIKVDASDREAVKGADNYSRFISILRAVSPHLVAFRPTLKGDVWLADAARDGWKRAFLECLSEMKRLRTLSCVLLIQENVCASEIWNAAPAGLEELSIFGIAEVPTWSIPAIDQVLPMLQYLDLSMCTQMHELGEMLKRAPALRELFLGEKVLDEIGRAHLALAFRSVAGTLKTLELQCTEARDFDMDSYLPLLGHLEELRIDGMATAASIAVLPPALRRLRMVTLPEGHSEQNAALLQRINDDQLPNLVYVCIAACTVLSSKADNVAPGGTVRVKKVLFTIGGPPMI